MEAIKPDQERVKNLLLDTVTLLCKNSLQYENYLRVEGLLGVAVDGKDTFFLHISERFQSEAYIERLNHEREEKEAAARKEQQEKEAATQLEAERQEEREQASRDASEALSVKVKTEAREQPGDDSDSDLVITGSSSLQSPQTVAQQASMVAGQRRAPRRPHSPSNAHNQTDSDYQHTQQNSPFVHSDSGDGDGSFSQYDSNQSIKTEDHWVDGPSPAKRQSVSNPWPNVTSMGDLSLQAAQASFQDGDGSFGGGGGDLSQPGCSAWPTNLPGSQDSNHRDVEDWEAEWQLCRDGTPATSERDGGQYVCDVCGKACKWKNNYERHLRSHMGKKPYACPDCGYSTGDQSNLKRHQKRRHHMAVTYYAVDHE